MADNVDIAPFAARVVAESPGEYSIWWEDPRDILRLEVTFAAAVAEPALPRLSYWQHTWPRVRLAANAVVGAGREGWLPIDDWITGRWQEAATSAQGAGSTWTYSFLPLDREDLPDAAGFPVDFRRTLKLRLAGAAMPPVERVAVYTASEWREMDVCFEWGPRAGRARCWDGGLEAFNGAVLSVAALPGPVEVLPGGRWRSTVEAGTAGVRARLRYAWNEDRNSYDATVVTLRAEQETSFSVAANDLLSGETVYIPALGVAVGRADGFAGLEGARRRRLASLAKTTNRKVDELPEQTWERAWSEMPPKKRMYFVLGVEGGRQKARLHPNGDLELFENFIRRVPGKDSQRLLWSGETLRYSFGLPAQGPQRRELADGYLPIMRATWSASPIAVEQESFATWLDGDIEGDKQGDDTVVALVRFTLMNATDSSQVARLTIVTADKEAAPEPLEVEDDLVYARRGGERRLRLALDTRGRGAVRPTEAGPAYEVALAPGDFHCIVAKVPFVTIDREDEIAALRALVYEAQRGQAAAFWRRRVDQGMQITVPNDDLNRFHRAHLTHMLIVNDREPGSDRLAPRCGGFHYGNFPDEGVMAISDLDRRGYTDLAEHCLEIMVHYQGTVPLPGDFETQDGVLYGSGGYETGGYNRGQGWAMWGLAEHYRYSRDGAWLERVAPAMIRACDWVTRERRRTMRLAPDGGRPIEHGFLPAGSLEDVTDYWHWLSSNVYACWGFRAIAGVLVEAGHPEGGRLQADADAFYGDLMRGFNESRARSPVVRLADGTWVPYYPPRLERRGRDFGWLREVLEGSMGLLVSEMVPLDDPAAPWILDDYEDNLYLSPRYGYPGTMPDFDGRWFDWGGFSMQSNLLLHPAVYLRRDDVKPFLRTFFNGFASTYYPETCTLAEHALPTLADWTGDHFKTSDEANVTHYLRLMLIEEQGDGLILGKAIPRQWLAPGCTVRIERALTYFGHMGYELRSRCDEGLIEADIELPERNSPGRAVLRLRHPDQAPLLRVEVNGEDWPCFDADAETIDLPLDRGPRLSLRAYYA